MGETPLHVAVLKESRAIIDILLRAGARTDIRSEFDETPAERAAKKTEKLRSFLNGQLVIEPAFELLYRS